MKKMWVGRVLLGAAAAVAVVTGLVGVSGGRATAADCAAAKAASVAVLARPGLEHRFVRLASDGRAPYIDKQTSQTIVQVRSLVSALSPEPGSIGWDDQTRTATFRHGGHTLEISFPRGSYESSSAMADGQPIPMHAFICEGKVYASARSVSGALNAGIKWYADGTVVVDPAWTNPSVAAARPAGCIEIEHGLFGAIRQAAYSVACRMMSE